MRELIPLILSPVLALITGFMDRSQARKGHDLILRDISVLKALEELETPPEEARELASAKLITDMQNQGSQRARRWDKFTYWAASMTLFVGTYFAIDYVTRGFLQHNWDPGSISWVNWALLGAMAYLWVMVAIRSFARRL